MANKIDENKVSPSLEQFRNIKKRYSDCILFFRMGDFYEMFEQDAIVASKELGITLTGKSSGQEERTPMCGVPFHSYENYAAKLISKGYKVAICEQFAKQTEPTTETKTKIKLVDRDVVRVITPGTVIDPTMLDENSNTYVMCVYKAKHTISYAYADISTGEFYVGSVSGDKALTYINDQIVRVMPAEIICNSLIKKEEHNLTATLSTNSKKMNEYYEWAFDYASCEKQLLQSYGLSSLKGYDFYTEECVIATGALWTYIKETQKRELKHLKMPKFIYDDQYMYIDTNTRRNLEIERTMREGEKKGTLLWVLDKTCTGGGSRMLKKFVNQPIQNIQDINFRLDCVEALKNNILIRKSLIKEFSGIKDIERIVAKLSYGTINPRECISLMETLNHSPKIKDILLKSNNQYLTQLGESIEDLEELKNKIFETIKEEPPAIMKDGGYIKVGFSPQLDKYRRYYSDAREMILQMEAREKERTGIKGLKIGYNKVFGYYIEVSKLYLDLVPYDYIRKQTVSNNERYITEELKEFEQELLSSDENARKLEAEIFENFKFDIMRYCSKVQKLALSLNTIDAYMSLAIVAEENNYVRPILTNGKTINIKNGRHPVIEKISQEGSFIGNDCSLDDNENRTMILTGPNMAGKSTYMRQVALITYLAHIGSFVPADFAEICIVDRIFTRIGASDDLAVGQSTFMVEMVEVSNILTFATDKSLIILDEVGRGTSTHDGLSIAWSVVEYLANHLTCKTLFATHYHELMQLESLLKGVKNYCISIKEINGELVFLRKIMRGSATRSYGIEVASLAGLPKEVISRSKQILIDLKDGVFDEVVSRENNQIESIPAQAREIMDILRSCDINNISRMLAVDTLL